MMGSSKDRSTSTHSEGNTDVRGKPTEGKRGARRVGTTRCTARKRRIRRICEADKGSETAFGRTERGGKRGHRIWRSECSRWFEDTRWTWWIGWHLWFELIRREWWAGRRRWFVWMGWSCSKWKTKSSKRRGREGLGWRPWPKISRSVPLLAHTGGCAVRWGRMS